MQFCYCLRPLLVTLDDVLYLQVKLSGRSQDASMVWAGPGLLAIITGDLAVRCWDLDTGESYLLDAEPLSSAPASDSTAGASNMPTEVFTTLAFCPQKGEALRPYILCSLAIDK